VYANVAPQIEAVMKVPPASQFVAKPDCSEVSGRAGLQASVQARYFSLGVGVSRRQERRRTSFSQTVTLVYGREIPFFGRGPKGPRYPYFG